VPAWALQALRGKVGSRVALGVRPQGMSDVERAGGVGAESSLEMKVRLVEFLGEKMEVYASTAKHPHVVAHIDARRGLQPNQDVRMYFDPNRLHFFAADAAGTTLASAPAPS
jgi:ABC-type sugar transport system ATPase subunit